MLEWIDLPDTDGMYQVSNHGDVRSNHSGTPRIMKQNPGTDGRLRLNLQINGIKKQFNTHKLVAICFLNHIPCGHKLVVNHIDFNYLNNHVSNLEIVTQRQNANQKHLKKGKTSKYTGVSLRSDTGKWTSNIKINNKNISLGCYTSEIEASIAYEAKFNQINKL
mgnify:CR=1 FL=1|tara:strand:- start:282 stop:773 length:492 start_codon:yes stop_codon:yes gene_type:complete